MTWAPGVGGTLGPCFPPLMDSHSWKGTWRPSVHPGRAQVGACGLEKRVTAARLDCSHLGPPGATRCPSSGCAASVHHGLSHAFGGTLQKMLM